MKKIPLVVDLDGTLIKTDMLFESLLILFKNDPLKLLVTPIWLLKGKAYLKKRIVSQVCLNYQKIPFNKEVIEWIKSEKNHRKVYLCTASDFKIASQISQCLGYFEDVIASDGKQNVSGKIKAQKLIAKFGLEKFEYVGNSFDDLEVWKNSASTSYVGSNLIINYKLKKQGKLNKIFPNKKSYLIGLLELIRIHQWVKNVLIIVPLIASQRIKEFTEFNDLLLSFIAFSFCASSIYIINDLLDLDNDRADKLKKKRPLASGNFKIIDSIFLMLLLISTSILMAFNLNFSFLIVLIFYIFLNLSYSYSLKKIVIIDCIILSFLYTLRIICGTYIFNLNFSFWLITFSVFLFLSLAFLKRFAELKYYSSFCDNFKIHGRGYSNKSLKIVRNLGILSGYISIFVFCLYLFHDESLKLYKKSNTVFYSIPVIFFWINWIWSQALKGKVVGDPVLFALKDITCLLSAIIFFVIIFLGGY